MTENSENNEEKKGGEKVEVRQHPFWMKSIKGKIFALLVLSLVVLIGSNAFMMGRSRRIQERRLYRSLADKAQINSGNINARIVANLDMLQMISTLPEIKDDDIYTSLRYLRGIAEHKAERGSDFFSFGLTGLDGLSREAKDPRLMICRKESCWLRAVNEGAAVAFSEPGHSEAYPGVVGMIVAVPVYRNGALQRILHARLGLDKLSEIVSGMGYGERGRAFIVDQNGIVLAHPHPYMLLRDGTEASADGVITAEMADAGRIAIAEKIGTAEFVFRGIDSILSYHPVPVTGWVMVVVADRDEVFAEIRALTYSLTAVVAGSVFLLLLLGLYTAGKITRPLRSLSSAAARLGQGDLDTEVAAETEDETGYLAEVFEKMRRSLKEMMRSTAVSSANEIIGWMLDTKDPYTAGHQQRVARLSQAIAEEMGLSYEQVRGVYTAATLHDIGKITVPIEFLNKPGKLSEIEMGILKTHVQAGHDALKAIDFNWPVAQIVLQHHERLDGSGYPQGLMGKDILLEAKILAVADVVEAMSSNRPYRPAIGIDKALEEISQHSGVLYDKEAVDICIRLFRENRFELEEVMRRAI